MAKVKLFNVTSVKIWILIKCNNLIIQITGIFKSVVNPGIAQNVAVHFFFLLPYKATKTSCLAPTLIVTSHSGKIQKAFIIAQLLVNQFNNATRENSNDPEKISSSKYYNIKEMPNIEIYLTEININHVNARLIFSRFFIFAEFSEFSENTTRKTCFSRETPGFMHLPCKILLGTISLMSTGFLL